jgi:DNA-binding SARP family transcriptional activator/ATP/maltotriose-dependent transcriptional regulator MalT
LQLQPSPVNLTGKGGAVYRSTPAQQRHACRVVVAAAGYGKTTALRGWYPAAGARWHRGVTAAQPPGGPVTTVDAPPADIDGLAALILDEARGGVRQIVVDDLPRLPADAARGLLAVAGDLPDDVGVVLSSRWPLAPAAGPLPRGAWRDVGPADLALPLDQVAEVLAAEYDLTDPDLPERVREATAGWPALVHLAAETLRAAGGAPLGPLQTVLAEPGGPVATYLVEEVLPALPEDAVALLRHVGDLAPVGAGLCRALGLRRADETVRLLRRTGVLTCVGSPPAVPGGPAPQARVVPVLAEALRLARRRATARRAARTAVAADWYDRHGPPVAAARAYHLAGRPADCARVLDRHGDALLVAGHAQTVVDLAGALPEPLRSRRLRLLHGDALRCVGDLQGAARAYQPVAAGTELDAGLAWRMGRIHYQRGDARAALEVFEQARRDAPDPRFAAADAALLAAWTAHARLLAGDAEAALAGARRAVTLAAPVEGADGAAQAGALATAHVSVALCLGVLGDDAGSEEHYRTALPIAEETGDVILLARIFINRTYLLLRGARYGDALTAARTSGRYAAAACQPSLRSIAVSNEADALAMLGHFDEAVRHYERAIAGYQQMGSRRVAGAHLGLGEVYRRRGWREQARGAYEAAVRVAGPAANAHVLVPAEAGLALVLLPDDVMAAAEHAARAAERAGSELALPALLAQGWVALCRGERVRAGELAADAARLARGQGDRQALADALELRGTAAESPAAAREALREAHAIWTDAGAPVESARIQLALCRLPDARPDDRLRGLLAAERLTAAGALVEDFRARAGEAAGTPVAEASSTVPAAVDVQALGRFEVRVGGEVVPASRWQSRKARDLLRILVARRGRPVPRDELCELLWPDDDPDKTGHRLSVLLSLVRGVLDPARAVSADHFLIADQGSIALDITRVRVDVEDFLAYVAHARRLLDAGDVAEARALLVTVERHHQADAFEDEPYAQWCGPLREEVRAAHLSLLRMLARVSRAEPGTGPEAAIGYLLRLLERDPYDEAAHRALVRTMVGRGQHGEARRAFERYGEAMRAIGVHPPDRALLAPVLPASANGRSR